MHFILGVLLCGSLLCENRAKNEGHNKLSMMGRIWTNHLGPARKAREAACPRKPA